MYQIRFYIFPLFSENFRLYSITTSQLQQEMELSKIFGNADLIREQNMFEQVSISTTISNDKVINFEYENLESRKV